MELREIYNKSLGTYDSLTMTGEQPIFSIFKKSPVNIDVMLVTILLMTATKIKEQRSVSFGYTESYLSGIYTFE